MMMGKTKPNVSTTARREVREISAVMDDGTYDVLRNYIYQLSGIYLTGNKKEFIESRLQKRITALTLSNFDEYLKYLREKGARNGELGKLMDAITITDTQFFRDKPQLEAFVKVAFPEMLEAQKGNAPLRVLSIGCATGEEIYSLVILIAQHYPEIFKNRALEFIGTDINENALKTAYHGAYRSYNLKGMESDFLNHYFMKKGDIYLIRPEIREKVRFRQVSLTDAERMQKLGKFHLIFCRNVLIYFDREARNRSVKTLAEMLEPGGYLFVGQAESLHGIEHPLDLILFNRAIGYKKMETA